MRNVTRTETAMISSFADKETEAFFKTGKKPRSSWQQADAAAKRKLDMLDAAERLSDLGSPPGNLLEALLGNRAGQHSIRINKQWRVCFVWTDAGPTNVEITDYH